MISRLLSAIVIVVLSSVATIVAHQDSWQRIAPVGHSFSVLMPTQATEASRRIPVNEHDSIPVAVYYSVSAGKRFVVAGFFKTAPDITPVLSTDENFISAMEQSFKGGEMAKSLVFDRDVSLKGVAGKQYHVRLGEYSGVARFLASENAFYALMVIGAEETDGDVARFLSSFAVGEVNTNAESSGVSGTTVVTMVGSASEVSNRPSAASSPERPSLTLPPEPWPQPVGPITGGVLNGKAILLARPEYPKAARKNHDSGTVTVQILIDELGNVIRARAINGPASLQGAAVAAASQSRFTPTRLMGQPVRVNGVIIYNFVAR